MTTKITTADATGTEGIAVDLTMIITTAMRARVWMKTMSMILNAKEIVLCINGKEMGDVTTTTMFVGVIGMVETAADTARDQMRINMATVRSVSAATRMYPIRVMANARYSSGVETATAMTATITADVIGMAGIVVDKRQHFRTVKNVAVKIQTSKAL